MIEARRRSQAEQSSKLSKPSVEATVGFIKSPEEYPSHVKDIKEMVSSEHFEQKLLASDLIGLVFCHTACTVLEIYILT